MASIQDQINAAISAHFAWKSRLKAVIETGESNFKPEIVATNNNCDFGKWLYSDEMKIYQSLPQYSVIAELHTKFHKLAASVLEMALKGDKDKAMEAIDYGSEYMDVTSHLTIELTNWRDSF